MNRDEVINRLADSVSDRPVEIAFFNDALNFSSSTRYPAAIRYFDVNEFYVVIPPAEESEELPDDNALKNTRIMIFPLGVDFEVQSSIYEVGLGHLLVCSNFGIHQRKFLRIAFDERIYVSVIGDDNQQKGAEIEVQVLNLSQSGIAIRCRRGTGLTPGTSCQLKIANPDFPGYDPSQGVAVLNGRVARVFTDDNLSDEENLGIKFIFDDVSEEFTQIHLIDKFCKQIAFSGDPKDQNLREILDLTTDLSSSLDLDTLLLKISASASKLVSAEGSAILLFDDEKRHLDFKVASGEKAPILSRTSLPKDTGGVAWWVAQTGEPAVVNDVGSDVRFTKSVDKMTDFKTKSILAVPIILDGEILGVLEAVNRVSGSKFTEGDLYAFTVLANQIAIVIRNTRMAEHYENFFTHAFEVIVKAIESIGVLIGLMSPGHCWRVAALATSIGQQFRLSEVELENLYYGAVLHDIGILEIQGQKPSKFNYAGNYTTEDAIRFHSVAGINMIKEIKMWKGAASIIRHHHEHFDGMGYPDELAGERIPLGARIVAVVEAYEEMLCGQQDELVAQEQAISAIKSAAGTQFDPEVVEVFVNQVVQSR